MEGRHVLEVVRDDRPPGGRLDERVDVHDPRAPGVGPGEGGEHAGALEAALTPMTNSASAVSQSARSTVPLPVPSEACRALPLASWHMGEQSGRLFVPSSRAISW
ncbi:hypothetical protein GCM10010275_64090 [Streptomyces litmocidini]|nr:hypothetical protein GCM10010275_64090 [Streptomyces litmocidini]